MTNEEAINILEDFIDPYYSEEFIEAVKMAISALSKTTQETEIRTEESAEYFKKSEVLEMLEKINKAVEDGEGYQYEEWVDYVEELPTYPANLAKESGVLVNDLVKDGDYIPAEDLLNECYDIVIDGERFRVCQEESIIGIAMARGIKLPQTDYENYEAFGWCKGCKEYDTEKHCCHRYSSFIRESLQENVNAVLEDIKEEMECFKEDNHTFEYGGFDKAFDGIMEIINKHISRKE